MQFIIGKGSNIKLITVFEEIETLETGKELFDFLKEKELFKGKSGEVYGDFSLNGENILLLGLGKKDKITINNLRKAFFKAAKELAKFKINEVEIEVKELFGLDAKDVVAAIAEGLLHSEYAFDKYISDKKNKVKLNKVYLDIESSKDEELESAIEEVRILIDALFLSRDLVNERAMNMYPEILANKAKEQLEPLSVDVEIFGREKIEELGMKAFLAVAEGSNKEPKFIVMNYTGIVLLKKNLLL